MADRVLFVAITIIALSLLVVGIFFYYLLKGHHKWKQKIKHLPANRQINTKQDFVSYFSRKGYSPEISTFIYEQTQKFLRASDLVLLPQDDLITLYEREQDEWFYIFNKWFDTLERNHPEENTLNDLLVKHKKINFEYIHELFERN